MLKTKLPKAETWPTSKAPALPPVKYSRDSIKEDSGMMNTKNKGGKDSRPWNSTKVCPYDKQS